MKPTVMSPPVAATLLVPPLSPPQPGRTTSRPIRPRPGRRVNRVRDAVLNISEVLGSGVAGGGHGGTAFEEGHPAAEVGDVAGAERGVGLAQETLDRLAVGQFHGADRQGWS